MCLTGDAHLCVLIDERLPLGELPLMEEPLSRVAVNLTGPLSPVSEESNVLTAVDYATRYPKAIPLTKIETEHVTEALLDVFPKEVLCDRGSQFLSDSMCEVC